MMRKIITFLGTTNYIETTYKLDNIECKTSYCVEAIVNALNAVQEKPIEQVLVCVTDEAKAKNYPNLEKALQAFGVVCQPIHIPNGKNEQELWQIFQAITDQIKADDEIWFDITSSFRSLPFVVFLVVAFLRQVQNVSVKRVLYGAYEKDATVTPILDLTEFVQMLDWMNAANRFTQQGDGDQLANLIEKSQPPSADLRDNQNLQNAKNSLTSARKGIEQVSLAMRLNQPFSLAEQASKLDNVLQRARPALAEWATPFPILLDQVLDEYKPFARVASDTPVDIFTRQLHLITWYKEKNRPLQAVTLAREWIVSWVGVLREPSVQLNDLRDKQYREHLEIALNNAKANRAKTKPSSNYNPKFTPFSIENIADADEWVKIWDKIADCRNKLAHCGTISNNAMTIDSLNKSANSILEQLQELAHKSLKKQGNSS
jgi:CRISPR-associated Csx2 family protein